jgi:hypothetical protein
MATIDRASADYTPSSPSAANLGRAIGFDWRHGSINLTADEVRSLADLYGFDLSQGDDLGKHGSRMNLMRHAEADGMRMIAWLAKFCEPGDDPVRVLVQLAMLAGWDVDPVDAEWADPPADQETEG